jgi:hypothetical protein
LTVRVVERPRLDTNIHPMWMRSIWFLFLVVLILSMPQKRKVSGSNKSGPRVKISRPDIDEAPTTHVRHVTLHANPSGRINQNISHTVQSLPKNIPELNISDDYDDGEDMIVDPVDPTGAFDEMPGLSEGNDPDDGDSEDPPREPRNPVRNIRQHVSIFYLI